jgi:hypothetical protein
MEKKNNQNLPFGPDQFTKKGGPRERLFEQRLPKRAGRLFSFLAGSCFLPSLPGLSIRRRRPVPFFLKNSALPSCREDRNSVSSRGIFHRFGAWNRFVKAESFALRMVDNRNGRCTFS